MLRPAAALLVLLATLCLGLGTTLPLVTLDRLWLFTDTPSLLGIVHGLWSEGQGILTAIVLLVSILFPLAKLVWLQLVVAGATRRGVSYLHALGRWSMMDVLLVALLIFAAKTSGLATAVTQPGLWFYAAATLMAAAAALLVERSTE